MSVQSLINISQEDRVKYDSFLSGSIFVDFEFNSVTEEKLNLVCVTFLEWDSLELKNFWLYQEDYAPVKEYILSKKDKTFIAYQAVAEGRSFYSMGLDPYTDFKWVDLWLEYRNLSNNNDELNYGKQLVEGKVKFTRKPKPKWERTEKDIGEGFKPTHSLAEATYKLTGKVRDTDHKTLMRDIIISNVASDILKNKEHIMKYCDEDVVYLPELYVKMLKLYSKYLGTRYVETTLPSHMEERSKYSALTAIREARGYPANIEKMRNFSGQTNSIIYDCQREINELFPDIKPFRWNRPECRYSLNQKAVRDWIEQNCDASTWMKTDGGKSKVKELSLKLEAWTKIFDFKHTYPTDNFGAQMVRYLKLKQNMSGFVIRKEKKSIWDSVGSDNKVRPYMNIYGSQSSRSQPPSTAYILLKPAWTRVLVEPPPGKVICSIDYGSEEYLISALFFNDRPMINAYKSGDVYLAFAKDAGIAPKDATKASHKKERDICKPVVLGISYLMTKYGLANKLTQDTGVKYTEEQAQEYIDSFYSAYSDFHEGQQEFIDSYYEDGVFVCDDGWIVWGDNDNQRSVGNVPIQQKGAEIMRKADRKCYEDGIEVPCTLHDALYIMFDYGDWGVIDRAMKHMTDAFVEAFPEKMRKDAKAIRLDPYVWGPDIETESIVTPGGLEVESAKLYIDERAEDEYERFKKYFNYREEVDL